MIRSQYVNMKFNGPQTGCKKIRTELEPVKEFLLYERFGAFSIRDLEKLARKGRGISGKANKAENASVETVRQTAIEVLINKYKVNELRELVKTSLKGLSGLDNDIGKRAANALEEINNIESRRQVGPGQAFSQEEYKRICINNKQPIKNQNLVKKKKKR